MSGVEKRIRAGRVSWRAHHRAPDGKKLNRSCPRKVDAGRFLTTLEASKLTGSYLDPSMARLTAGDWSARWLDGQAHLKPSTRERYAGIVREHVDPRWSTTRLADVAHSDIQSWVSSLMLTSAPATVRKVHRVPSPVLASAVKDGRLVRNPADGVNLPRVVLAERRYLTHAQAHALANGCGRYRLVVLLLAYTGSGSVIWPLFASAGLTCCGVGRSSRRP